MFRLYGRSLACPRTLIAASLYPIAGWTSLLHDGAFPAPFAQ